LCLPKSIATSCCEDGEEWGRYISGSNTQVVIPAFYSAETLWVTTGAVKSVSAFKCKKDSNQTFNSKVLEKKKFLITFIKTY